MPRLARSRAAMTAAVPPKVVAGAAALALSSLLLLYRRRRRSAPTRAASPAAPAAPAPAKAPPRRETLTVELQDVCDVDLLTDAEAAPEPVELRGGAALPEALVRLWRDERMCDVHLHAGRPGAETSHAAHRVVLAAQSGFLGRLLSKNAPGTKAPPTHLRLTHLSSEACAALLTFAYRGSCVVGTPALLVQLVQCSARTACTVICYYRASSTRRPRALEPRTLKKCYELGERVPTRAALS